MKVNPIIRETLFLKKYKYAAEFTYEDRNKTMFWLSQEFLRTLTKCSRLISEFAKAHKSVCVIKRTANRGLYMYTNDFEIIKELSEVLEVPHDINVRKIVYYTDEKVKYFVNKPEKKYRMHLSRRSHRLNGTTYQTFCDFINNSDDIKPSRSLYFILFSDTRWRWTRPEQFFDFDDISIVTYFNLILPELSGEVYKLLEKPKNIQ